MRYVWVLVCVLVSCQTVPAVSYEEQAKIHASQEKVYTHATQEQVLLSIKELFVLADPSDVRMQEEQAGLTVRRQVVYFYFLGGNAGAETWKIHTTPEGEHVRVYVSVDRNIDGWVMVPTSPLAYQIFYERLDYLLGDSPDWPTCAALENAGRVDMWKGEDWLCTLADDRVPPGPLFTKR